MIAVDGLSLRFADRTLFDELSLTVPTGETHVLIGPSGAGKSCLLRCIGALDPFQSGTVTIGNQSFEGSKRIDWKNDESLRQIRMRVGMVFQQFNLFPHRTALENIIEGPTQVLGKSKAEAIAEARKLLEKVGMESHANRYPANLSGGEQQRVAIARALAMRPEGILMDEPTSALDPERVGEVLDVIHTLAEEGMTLLIATHEMAFAQAVAQQVHMMDQGKNIEYGPPAEIFNHPKEPRTRQFLERIQQTL